MAQKKITDLSLRTDFDATCNVPVDDTAQTWRCTGAQLKEFIRPNNGRLNVSTKTTTYTATSSDDVLLGDTSGGDFTITLPTAVGITGKVLEFHKTVAANKLTVDGSGTETIGGALTFILNTIGEVLKIVSDGTNWRVLDHKAETDWATFTMDINASTTNPTKGTVQVDEARWRRKGKFCHVQWKFKKTSGTGTAGSGNYEFTLPQEADEAYNDLTFRDASPAYATAMLVPGHGYLSSTGDITSSFRDLMVLISDNKIEFFLIAMATSTANIVSDAFGDLNGVSHMQVDFMYPVKAWQ